MFSHQRLDVCLGQTFQSELYSELFCKYSSREHAPSALKSRSVFVRLTSLLEYSSEEHSTFYLYRKPVYVTFSSWSNFLLKHVSIWWFFNSVIRLLYSVPGTSTQSVYFGVLGYSYLFRKKMQYTSGKHRQWCRSYANYIFNKIDQTASHIWYPYIHHTTSTMYISYGALWCTEKSWRQYCHETPVISVGSQS